MYNDEYNYTNITSGSTTQIATGKGKLHSIVVNTTAAGTVIAIDNTAGTTPTIGTLKSNVVENTYLYDVTFSKGLRIITAAGSDITVCWSQA